MSAICLATGEEGGMRRILYGLVIGGAILWALSAGAMTPEEVGQYCARQFSLEQYRASCMQSLSGASQAQTQDQTQRDLARQQANGLALFGSGNALINGMNQGFQNMQVHPYVLPPPQHYGTR
jgi:hypothetical protein